MDIELKPCPFCGGSAHVESYVVDAAVWCGDCGAKIARKHGRLEDTGYPDAIEAWNKRSADRASFDAGWNYHQLLGASQPQKGEK